MSAKATKMLYPPKQMPVSGSVILTDPNTMKILLLKRSKGQNFGGFYSFPGG